MKENPHLTPWVIPRWAIEGFCDAVKDGYESLETPFFVSGIIEHSPTHYLVITSGEDEELVSQLYDYLRRLFEVKDEEKSEQ